MLPGTSLGCEEALLGPQSIQPDPALSESWWLLPGPLLLEAPGSIQGPSNWHSTECLGPGPGDPDVVSLGQ